MTDVEGLDRRAEESAAEWLRRTQRNYADAVALRDRDQERVVAGLVTRASEAAWQEARSDQRTPGRPH